MPAQTSLSLWLRPSGAFDAIVDADAAPLHGAAVGGIGDAFAQRAGAGILHLGLVEVHPSLPPAWAWLRELGRQVLAAACRPSDLAELWPGRTGGGVVGACAHRFCSMVDPDMSVLLLSSDAEAPIMDLDEGTPWAWDATGLVGDELGQFFEDGDALAWEDIPHTRETQR